MWLNFSIPGFWQKKDKNNNSNQTESKTVKTDKKETPKVEEKTDKENSKSSSQWFSIQKPQTPSSQSSNKSNTKQESWWWIKIVHKEKIKLDNTNYTIQLIIIFIFWFLSFVFYNSYVYTKLYDTLSNKLPTQPIVAKYENYEKQINNFLHIYNFEKYEALPTKWKQAINTINQIIQATDLNYIHKWKLLTKVFQDLTNQTISIQNQIEQTKANITQYWFSPKEINWLLENKDWEWISLQRSLLSLEVIKFTTAMKVFGLLQTFLEQFSKYYWIDTIWLRKQMAFYSSRSEVDIERYLQDCYLNPFEDLKTCSFIWDFDNYYKYFEPQTKIDSRLFKELMNFIDQKLTETQFPSLAITFNQFNPESKKIAFKVTVNTFQTDEKELINQWILSPHIFIVTNIINLLKESRFVIWDAIDIKDMKIDTNKVEIWWKEYIVHTSTRNFDLPIQKEEEREIFDYSPNIDVYNSKLVKDTTNIDLEKYWVENKSYSKIKK